MKKLFVFMLLCALGLSSACNPATNAPSPSPSPEAGATRKPGQAEWYEGSYVQYPDKRDYTYSWWKEGLLSKGDNRFCIQTGYYGLTADAVTGMITAIGAIQEEYTKTQVLSQGMEVMEALPGVRTVAALETGGQAYTFRGSVTPTPYSWLPTRIIESGDYMQSFDVAAMNFAGNSGTLEGVAGRVEVKANIRYFSLNFELFCSEARTANLSYALTFAKPLSGTVSKNGKSIVLTGETGGYSVILPENQNSALTYNEESRTLTITGNSLSFAKNRFSGMSAIIIPSTNPTQQDIADYNAIAGVQGIEASAVEVEPKEGRERKFTFDETRGLWVLDLNNMSRTGANIFSKTPNVADRAVFTLKNTTSRTLKVPLMFEKDSSFTVEGFGALLRDKNTGEPTGLGVQLTRNWHAGGLSRDLWYSAMDGRWFHGFTLVEVPANSTVSYEICLTYNNWGTANVASHGQLCLIGWPGGSGQIWHTSTIGSSGEAFCYDPDGTCNYAFINDVRGVGFDPYEKGSEYVWGANNGGGNFIYYGSEGPNELGSDKDIVKLKMMRVEYKTHSPNLAEVIFTGRTRDDAVDLRITTTIARTNDISRATHTFEYKFLKDVTFERMAFYQIGGDNHNSGRWHGITIGNDEGPISYEIAGVTYGAEAELPITDAPGYVGGQGMQQIEVPGKGLFVSFTNSYEGINSDSFQSKNANRALSLLSFEANLNGVTYNKPALNIRSTKFFSGDSNLIELAPPAAAGNTIKAGSTVKGTVEYMNFPVSLKSYYFTSEIIKNIPAEEFDTWKMAHRYSVAHRTEATAQKGSILRQYPITVACEEGEFAAEITVKSGISFIPLTFANLPRYYNYRLEAWDGSAWQQVDQSYGTNDYWQAHYDAETQSYELTFNVEHSGNPEASYRYRLVSIG